MTLDQLAVYLDTPEAIAIRNQRYEQLLAYMEPEPELRELLALQLDPDGYRAYTNQEAADLLASTVGDIENRKKRLERRLLKYQKERASGQGQG